MNVLWTATTLSYAPKEAGLRTKAGVFSGSEVICRQQPQQRRRADSSCECYQTQLTPTHTTPQCITRQSAKARADYAPAPSGEQRRINSQWSVSLFAPIM